MAKRATKKARAEGSLVQGYLDAISKYDREFKKWEERSTKIIKRYRDEARQNSVDVNSAKFNILWSNVQILVPATFARVPHPDVSRRFRDQDPVGRVGALILERGLEFETQHYPDYRDTMTQCVHDRFLGGRGTAWIRYEPHFKDGETPAQEGQITEDVEAVAPEEQLDYECAPVDYVHWKDFGHSVARTWEEVTLVWRWVYMSEQAVLERFPEAEFPKLYKEGKCIIPFDATPEDLRRADRNSQTDAKKQAKICELWDKGRACAIWLSKSMQTPLDERPDPLKLQQFFPCPKPLYATITNDTLIPVPDFTLYQDQAHTLDVLAERAAGLAQMIQLKGVYDASADAAIGRLFTEGANGTLLPVKNWQAFSEKNGLKGQIDVYDLTPIAKALEIVYATADQQKQQVYEIMGISDIVRGASDPTETLGAQEMKGQYASMRLRAMQADVSRFATDVLQLKAQVMCSKFSPQTLVAISAAEQLSEIDKQAVPQALALLVGEERMQDPQAESPNPLRSFRIEVNADSMIQMNEAQEKQDRMEFLTANGAFMDKAVVMIAQAGAAAPIIVPLIMEMWKYGVTSFKVGKTIEGQFDEATEKLKQMASQPQPPKPDPEMAKVQGQMQIEQQKMQMQAQQAQQEAAIKQAEAQATAQREAQNAERDAQLTAQNQQHEAACKERELAMQDEFNRWKVQEDNRTKIEVAEIAAGAALDKAAMDAENAPEGEGAAPKPKRKTPMKKLAESQESHQSEMRDAAKTMVAAQEALAEQVRQLAEDTQAPVSASRGKDGRVERVTKGKRTMRVERGPDGVSLVPEAMQ